MSMDGIRVAVVGLGFGASFPPIYLDHPDVEFVGICDGNPDLLRAVGDRYDIDRRHTDVDEVAASSDYDAVQVVTPIYTHADLTLKFLGAGKHCATAVPMGTSLNDLHSIVNAERETGLVYMMMETAVYTHHFLYAKNLQQQGAFGKIQFLRGAHYQDMVGWPEYWFDLPPMHYATHAVSPLLAIADSRARSVHCFGSGTMEKPVKPGSNPYPLETALFQLDTARPLAMEITRSQFATARRTMESFNVYGSARTFEWQIENELPVLSHMEDGLWPNGHGHAISQERVVPPDASALLPLEIQHHTWQEVVPDPKNPHVKLIRSSGHFGSHPHLVHEFVRSIAEGRRSAIDSVTAANWTAPGICAHESAMRDGQEISIPDFNR